MTTFNKLTTNKKVVKIFSISTLSLIIAACSQTNPARIQDLSGASSSTSTNVASGSSSSVSSTTTYNRPPDNITTAKVNNTSSSTTVKQGGGNVVTTTQERIVYNRNYDDIPKGGYNGNTYTVKRGDTLFYIAWITGNDFRSLAAKNSIQAPYDLNVGQVLDVSGGTTVVVTKETTMPKAGTATKPTTKTTTTTTSTPTNSNTQPATKVTTTTSTSSVTQTQTASSNVANIVWQWPAQGKVIESFSNATKGIDIAGSLGDRIVAAADGKVVYAGNALPGYGNLIIIKHNDDYLTAYAHNQSILVKEQQEIKAGQQIATMGSTGTSSVRLHFEIRYQAKSVDPLKYLPKR